jgi:hypothetical protein
MDEIQRVLKPAGVAVVDVAAGDPKKGLPRVLNFSELIHEKYKYRLMFVVPIVEKGLTPITERITFRASSPTATLGERMSKC